MLRAFLAAACLCAIAACSPALFGSDEPILRSPGPLDVLEPADPSSLQRQISMCGIFPIAALDRPLVTPADVGPEFDALRASTAPSPEKDASWRMVIRDAARAVFVGKYFGEWFCAGFRWDGIGWTFDGYAGGGERLAIHIWDDLMTSSWYIDPSYDRPSPDDTEIHVLVTESSCSSSSYASGRIGAPLVESREQTLTITFGVRPLRGSHNCMGNPATPAILRLREPVGDRQLLDGSSHPAHEPVCGVMDDCGLMKSD